MKYKIQATYPVIANLAHLESFIEFLPNLEDNEKYYLSLFARKKYVPSLIQLSDKTQLARFLATKENMASKIKQLEVPMSSYRLKDKPVPKEALVLYINPTPRNLKKATPLLGIRCWNLYTQANNYNIHQEAMSAIQVSRDRRIFVVFDVDNKEIDIISLCKSLKFKHYSVIETRGGYHILIDSKNETEYRKMKNLPLNWHQLLREKIDVDQTGDQLTPVPGTYQGGFPVKMIKKNSYVTAKMQTL